jgi:hypothetical protein
LRRTIIHGAILAAVALAAILFLTRYVPFEIPSYLFYAGVILALAGLASLIWPLRFLLIRTRRVAAITLLAGITASACALLWPYRLVHSASKTALDRVMPDYQFNEVHSMRVRATPEAAFRAMHEVTLDEIRLVRVLLGARALAGGRIPRFRGTGQPMAKAMDVQFPVLAEQPGHEVVRGKALGPRVKVAFNVRVYGEGGGWAHISTETRVFATDAAAARSFGRYWRMVYPGSAIIRQMWLEAAAARLQRGAYRTAPGAGKHADAAAEQRSRG